MTPVTVLTTDEWTALCDLLGLDPHDRQNLGAAIQALRDQITDLIAAPPPPSNTAMLVILAWQRLEHAMGDKHTTMEELATCLAKMQHGVAILARHLVSESRTHHES